MLKITVELYPLDDDSLKRLLGTMRIANDTSVTSEIGNYRYIYIDDKKEYTGTIKGFPRRLGFWRLIRECLVKEEVKERVLSGAELDDRKS